MSTGGHLMDVDKVVEIAMNTVNGRLLEFFKSLHTEISRDAPMVLDLAKITQDYTMRGGKRLRALLALIGYWSKEWTGGDYSVIADIMAAIELLQSYLLIHDDVIDRDELRRGGPTVHVWFANKCKEEKWHDCEHYGTSQAIIAGDLLEASAVSLIVSSRLEARAIRDLVLTYTRGLRKVALGQYLDVLFSLLPLNKVKEEDVLLMYKLKTSSYTVELPLHLGAIASGKYNNKLLEDITNYAIPAGIAFQIRDDIIGLFGDPRLTGKPAGSDVRSKKKTILVVKAYELVDNSGKHLLKHVYENLRGYEITDYHVEEVKRVIKESGALEYAEKFIDKHVKESIEALRSSSEICEEAKKFLEQITYKLSYREK